MSKVRNSNVGGNSNRNGNGNGNGNGARQNAGNPTATDGADRSSTPVVPADRLLTAAGSGGALSLAQHRQRIGARPPISSGMANRALIAQVQQAGLRGRGGAGFPTGTKLAGVADSAARGLRPVVVVNGSEGEPASAKDKQLLAAAPHLVLDGAAWAACAVGADEVIVIVDAAAHEAAATVDRAIAERAHYEPEGLPITLVQIPERYVSGEERAGVRFLNGGPAKPLATSPRPFEAGVGGRPTLLDNVETLAHLGLIAARGADWFRRVGSVDEPGTMLLTISGAVQRPGVYEAPTGTPIDALCRLAGGATTELQAFLVGGYAGAWLPAELGATPLDRRHLAPYDASPGCGVLLFLPTRSCGLTETARIMDWLASQTAGQCGPCVHGLRAIADATIDLATGKGTPGTVAQLHRWAGQVDGRGACRFPDGAVHLLRSALSTFAAEVDRHARGYGCPAARVQSLVPTPHAHTLVESPTLRVKGRTR